MTSPVKNPARGRIAMAPTALAALALIATFPLIRSCRSEPTPANASEHPDDLAIPGLPPIDGTLAFAHLEAQVRIGPRPAGSQAAEFARVHIESALEKLGLEPRREAFLVRPPRSAQLANELELANVVVEIPPRAALPGGDEHPWILVGAHYDTKRAGPGSGLRGDVLGANDGASGVGLLLELARSLVTSEPRAVGYRLVFFDGEESFRWRWQDPDNRYGSRHHAANMVKSGDRERFRAMVLVDLIADRQLELVHDISSDDWLRDLFFDTAVEIGHGRHIGRERLAVADDHLSFRDIGLPVVDLIDLNYPDETNRFWHSDDDTLENVSAESLQVMGEIVAATLPKLERRLIAPH